VIFDGLKIVLNRLEVLYTQNFTNEMEWHLTQLKPLKNTGTLSIKLLIYYTIGISDLISHNSTSSYMVLLFLQ